MSQSKEEKMKMLRDYQDMIEKRFFSVRNTREIFDEIPAVAQSPDGIVDKICYGFEGGVDITEDEYIDDLIKCKVLAIIRKDFENEYNYLSEKRKQVSKEISELYYISDNE